MHDDGTHRVLFEVHSNAIGPHGAATHARRRGGSDVGSAVSGAPDIHIEDRPPMQNVV